MEKSTPKKDDPPLFLGSDCQSVPGHGFSDLEWAQGSQTVRIFRTTPGGKAFNSLLLCGLSLGLLLISTLTWVTWNNLWTWDRNLRVRARPEFHQVGFLPSRSSGVGLTSVGH